MIKLLRYWPFFRGKLQSHWLHIPCQVIVASFCVYWYRHVPAPSKAVLILTGVTVVMALLDMRPAHKAIYLLLVLCLMFIENRAINSDRFMAQQAEDKRVKDEHAEFQRIADGLSIAQRAEEKRVTDEHAEFEGIADGLRTTIANGNKQFSVTSTGLSSINNNV